ncbi:unnamed protein product [Fructobacillus cardui]|uniref:hypothetical protein n=1 Tax=Fructobacillus cardui TaxID=2893170 RepID=UPI002DA90708|nr:unnamed protein product [Fructobacillus cardui]
MGNNEYSKVVLNSIGHYQDELHKAETILSGQTMPGQEPSHRELLHSMNMAQGIVSNVLADLATLEDMTKDQLS